MGINEWTRELIKPGSYFNRQYGIKPDLYLIMYSTSSSHLIFQDPQTGQVVHKIYASSAEELIGILLTSAPDASDLKAFKELVRDPKNSRGGGQIRDHHIIPVHLWTSSKLIVEAQKYGLIDMDKGSENKMLLPTRFHETNHGKNSPYSLKVRKYLQNRWNDLVQAGQEDNPDAIRETLVEFIDELRAFLDDEVNKGGSMNNF